jgi:hypothetical protein
VGFWDRQINELLTGIGQLLGGGAPQTPPTVPSPPPLPPVEPYNPGQGSGPYPPWIPENETDLSHIPESAIAGTHGDYSVKPNEDVVVWPPPESPGVGNAVGAPVPGSLPPYYLHDYREIAPARVGA